MGEETGTKYDSTREKGAMGGRCDGRAGNIITNPDNRIGTEAVKTNPDNRIGTEGVKSKVRPCRKKMHILFSACSQPYVPS
jgi:hypothetical protein